MNMNEYIRKSVEPNFIPRDPHSHAFSLLKPEKTPKEIYEILTKDILLANISDDRLLRLYQREAQVLTRIFELMKRNERTQEELRRVFDVLFVSFEAELGLTRAKDGTERKLQNSFDVEIEPRVTGFKVPSFLRRKKKDDYTQYLEEGIYE
jgi:hypothetical protein